MKKRKNKQKLNQVGGLGKTITKQRVFHVGSDGIIVENIAKGDTRKRQRIVNQTPLDRYLQRREITQRQWEAGQKLHALHRRAGLAQTLTVNYDQVRVDGGGAAMQPGEALTDYFAALRSIGRDLGSVAQHVVIVENSPREWAKNHGHLEKSGITVLRICLDALGDHFGMPR